jgi:hypothetical protein
VRKFKESLALLRETKRHDVVPHILLARFDTRPLFARRLIEELETSYDGELFETVIHPTVRFNEAYAQGESILMHDPDSRGALDIRNLARELDEKQADLTLTSADRWITLLHGPWVEESEVVFVADFPLAKSVSVTGTFCNWTPEGLSLKPREDGLWERRLPLAPGSYQYRYVVDGAWRPDPHNEATVPNEYGDINSLVTVPG